MGTSYKGLSRKYLIHTQIIQALQFLVISRVYIANKRCELIFSMQGSKYTGTTVLKYWPLISLATPQQS